MTLAIFLSVLIISILLGLPVAFALLLSSIALMFHMDMFSADILAQGLLNGVDSFTLLAIPFFLVAGEVMSTGGLSTRIVRLATTYVGHRKGGLGYVAILTSVLLAGLSGSAVADAAALVSILYPMMKAGKYPEGSSMGLLASGGIIAPVIPPSIPLILVGVAGGISIKNLFLGGIIPGLLMGLTLMLVWGHIAKKEKLDVVERASKEEKRAALKDGIWALFLPIIIIVGIRFGIFTPTEAAVVAAAYAVFVSTVIYRELTFKKFFHILLAAGRSTAMVMFLVGCAMVAAWLITVAQLPQQLAEMLGPLVDSPRLLMAVIMLLVLCVGMVMDLSPTILILVPLLMPIVKLAGIDPTYFGLMFVINCSIGLLTPPVGTVLNVVCGVAKVQMSTAVKGVIPFIAAYLMLLTMFVLFPEIITVPMQLVIG
ncbi:MULTISPECIES: TRAP transporter large permease subunit [Buttiauxella]|jgi:tripartite ATP-independent transporter DctM subunit|uniref:TRAP transporter large permease protein n=1 Tax=Buttiauxella ferragutiae ATCC 51602 TaxID=1354252 RepID=A0ABX2W4Y2_9ENTR|nr:MULTISPECIES: TRAP transporter large permease subunit [Buttiauxella]MCE0824851.1 TRAP transporter large permease subunit [Buttiauxella ferragutiae]OAT25775.1 2,3-diketo-L-gulonate TRAP transporter large permease protein [Buttiauxella ferragutiae ATCC 51602]TDN54114.1 tripartite ATP-independent transporter DctM subunit [Buttiauxella sp. JUb87]UNK59410.1 TRAP transporter large permease subunit [Buttiauxella ferragutiae]